MRIVRYYPRAISGDGGMTNAVRCWSESMLRAGAAVTIAYEDGEVPEAWRKNGVDWVQVRHTGPGFCRIPIRLQDVLRDADLMVLHSAWTPHNNWAGMVARQAGVPYVLEPRGAYDPHIVGRHGLMKKIWLAGFEGTLLRGALAVHLFFDAEREHLRRLGYSGAVIVAPNGVVTPPGVHWDGGSGDYVLWMGRFDPEHKGIDLLIQAIDLMPKEKRPQVRLYGPRWRTGKEKMTAMVGALSLQKWIEVCDPVHGMAKFDLMARAKGFIYPSRWEGFGNSVAEAISLGVPTVVTPYPFGQFLASRRAAILADATPSGLASGLAQLENSNAAQIAQRGAEVAHQEITWDVVARSWLSQIQPLL